MECGGKGGHRQYEDKADEWHGNVGQELDQGAVLEQPSVWKIAIQRHDGGEHLVKEAEDGYLLDRPHDRLEYRRPLHLWKAPERSQALQVTQEDLAQSCDPLP